MKSILTCGAALVSIAFAGVAAAKSGDEVYQATCAACHATGVANAPRYGNKADWAARAKLGRDALVASVMKGKGAMPPKGAAGAASDAELRAAVEYMVAQAK